MSGHAEERKATQRLPARARRVWAKTPHTPQQFTTINTFLRSCCRWQSRDLIPLWSEQWASLTPPLTTANVFSQMETDKLEVHGDGFVFSGPPPPIPVQATLPKRITDMSLARPSELSWAIWRPETQILACWEIYTQSRKRWSTNTYTKDSTSTPLLLNFDLGLKKVFHHSQSRRRHSLLQDHKFSKSRKERGKNKPWNVTIDRSVAGDLFGLIAPRTPMEPDLGSESWVHIQLQDGPKSFLVDSKGTWRTHGGGRGAEGLPSLFDPGSVEGQDRVFVILWISWVYYLIFFPEFYILINDRRNCNTASAVNSTISLVKLDSHV